MERLLPTRETFLSRPQRPSRLFIILFAVSACLNAILFVQVAYRQGSLAYERQGWQNSLSSAQAQALSFKQERDQALADVQKKSAQLTDLDAKLTDSQKKYDASQAQLNSVNQQLKAQQDQISTNSAEIQSLRSRPPLFKFESNTVRDVSQDQTDVKQVVTAAYDVIAKIYGTPYILHQITISFTDNLTIQGAVGEISIENSASGISITIKIPKFDKSNPQDVNTIVHEIIHGFHGVAALNAPVEEEGITVAATDAVIDELSRQKVVSLDSTYLNITDSEAASLNSRLGNPPADSSFYKLPQNTVESYYQLAGWDWRHLWQTDSTFFSRFNELLYAQVSKGISPTPALVHQLIIQTLPTVAGQPTENWLNSQVVFNPV